MWKVKLTTTERRIARFAAIGLRNIEIGDYLGITEHSVKNRLKPIFDKTGMGSRLELAMWYWQKFPEELKLAAELIEL